MSKGFTDILLFASMSVNVALMMFFAGVYRKVINELDEGTFKNITEILIRYSAKSPFMIIALNSPLIIAIPYYYMNGFSNWWITASLIFWLVAGSISKILKLPVYKNVSTLKNDDTSGLNEMRRKLNRGNSLQALLYTIALILMAVGFIK